MAQKSFKWSCRNWFIFFIAVADELWYVSTDGWKQNKLVSLDFIEYSDPARLVNTQGVTLTIFWLTMTLAF